MFVIIILIVLFFVFGNLSRGFRRPYDHHFPGRGMHHHPNGWNNHHWNDMPHHGSGFGGTGYGPGSMRHEPRTGHGSPNHGFSGNGMSGRSYSGRNGFSGNGGGGSHKF